MAETLHLYGLTADSLEEYKTQLQNDALANPGTAEASYDLDMVKAIELQQEGLSNSPLMQMLQQDEWNLFCEDPNCGRNAFPADAHWVRIN